jgi:hypothetical protein
LLSLVSLTLFTYRRREFVLKIKHDIVNEIKGEFMPPSSDFVGIKKGKMDWLVFQDRLWSRVASDIPKKWNNIGGLKVPDRRMVGVVDANGNEYLLRFGILWVRRPNDSWSPLSINYRP